MQAAIDRVMQTFGLLVNLTAEQEQVAREKVSNFPASAHTDDENKTGGRGPSTSLSFSVSGIVGREAQIGPPGPRADCPIGIPRGRLRSPVDLPTFWPAPAQVHYPPFAMQSRRYA